ncbi:MAG: DUF4038 domain-containing protein [Caldilineaceae bacterium]
MIQAVALAEFDGLDQPNVYGERPLHDNDPTRPNEAYFAYVDELIDLAAAHNLYIGLLPTWETRSIGGSGVRPVIFDEQNAQLYGQFGGTVPRSHQHRLDPRWRPRSRL